jgi:hypothetical protein
MIQAGILLIPVLFFGALAFRHHITYRRTYVAAFGRPPTKPRNGIVELGQLAHSRNMYWRIFCNYSPGTKWAFQVELCDVDCALIWAEDGARGYWAKDGPTQEEAARELVDDILHGEAKRAPMHRSAYPAADDKRECPPELHGGPQEFSSDSTLMITTPIPPDAATAWRDPSRITLLAPISHDMIVAWCTTASQLCGEKLKMKKPVRRKGGAN